MAYLYILYSEKRDRYYMGSTSDLVRRLTEHEAGITPSTREGRPWVLIFSKQIESLPEARRVEARIKRWKSRKLIERIIAEKELRI